MGTVQGNLALAEPITSKGRYLLSLARRGCGAQDWDHQLYRGHPEAVRLNPLRSPIRWWLPPLTLPVGSVPGAQR